MPDVLQSHSKTRGDFLPTPFPRIQDLGAPEIERGSGGRGRERKHGIKRERGGARIQGERKGGGSGGMVATSCRWY